MSYGKPIDKIVLHRQRQRFSKEFKLAAIELLKAGQKPGTQIALELGMENRGQTPILSS